MLREKDLSRLSVPQEEQQGDVLQAPEEHQREEAGR